MEGHASFPDGEEFQWILAVVGKVVKERVADPPTEKHAEGCVDDHVIDLVLPDLQPFTGNFVLNKKVSRGQADQVHQSVPAELNGAQSHKNRVDVWVGDGGWGTHYSAFRIVLRERVPIA